MTATAAAKGTRTFPVMEVFGPCVQGEGILAGAPTYFVRFGGCDFRCSWCDSMFAVDPAQVKEHAERLDADEILARIRRLGRGPTWVTLSGGNPALLKLDLLRLKMHEAGLRVAVETQGSRWREWLAEVDCLTVSPKPPSSGMVTPQHDRQFESFMEQAQWWRPGQRPNDCLKIVVFDEEDLEWARGVFRHFPEWPLYLSAGTPPIGEWGTDVVKGVSARQAREEIGERYRWLCDRTAGDSDFRDARILVQLHVIGYGHTRAV